MAMSARNWIQVLSELTVSKVAMVLAFLGTTHIKGQHWDQRVLGGTDLVGFAVEPTSDGGYVAAGGSQLMGFRFYYLKVDADGVTEWQDQVDLDGTQVAMSIKPIAAGGYVVAGLTGPPDHSEVLVVRLDLMGHIVWMNTYAVGNSSRAEDVVERADGNFVVAGSHKREVPAGDRNMLFLLISPDGALLRTVSFGTDQDDSCLAIERCNDGGFIATGGTYWSAGAGLEDVFLVRLTEELGRVWEKTYGGEFSDFGSDVRITADGGFVIGGTTQSFGAGKCDYYLIKTNRRGELQWQQTFGGPDDDRGRSAFQTADGGFIFAGHTLLSEGESNILIIKTDGDGNVMCQENYNESAEDIMYRVRPSLDGGFIGVGESFPQLLLMKRGLSYLLRGDCNADGEIDISDAVCILYYLFIGRPIPNCYLKPKAGLSCAGTFVLDIDQDGRLTITDAVLLLGTLFQGAKSGIGDCAGVMGDCKSTCVPSVVPCFSPNQFQLRGDSRNQAIHSERSIGQTFKVSTTGTLIGLELLLANRISGAAEQDLTVEILEVSDLEVLGSVLGSIAIERDAFGDWPKSLRLTSVDGTQIDLSSLNIHVESGKIYAFRLSTTAKLPFTHAIREADDAGYSRGRRFVNDDVTETNTDVAFKLCVLPD